MVSIILILWFFLTLCVSDLSSSESFPTSYIIATNEGMITFSPANSSSTKINPRPVIGVDFRFAKQDFFFISNNEIFYSYYSYYSKIYSDVIPIMVFPHTLSDVVVDWVHLRIYVASASVGAIYEATITGSSRAIRIAVDKVEDLAIDPYERQLFFLSNGNLGSLDLRNSLQTKHSIIGPMTSVAKMALDHHEAIIYLIGQDVHGSWILLTSDYTGSQHTELFRGPQLTGTTALDAFNSGVVWCSEGGCFHLRSSDCQQLESCSVAQLSYESRGEAINDIRFYNSLVQTPSTEVACSQLNCSYSCSVVSLYSVTCTCPPGTILDPGGKVCKDKPPKVDPPFFDRLKEAVYQWASELTTHSRTFILVCSGLMLLLLLSGICLLTRLSTTNYSRKRNDSYDLSEMGNTL
ncbi:uncharacterized protein LOC124362227 isoform X2 [Homalodisca vitripennis]|uniref:uncharacterized protein LOC124362227 isoform X2 n=1 Tax=Homalodisca vitripennis TaxID=197043 RepID=UPI001EEB13F5|nr:uncharacterized protein LOC124362227 isoform X2 [Homalodisca vitripennis]